MLTRTQLNAAAKEAPHYTDPDAFISDILTSSAFLPPDSTAEPDLTLVDDLRAVWTAAGAPFRDFLAALGLSQSACARRYGIPLRTVQNWAGGVAQCPTYLRLMMAETGDLLPPVQL